MLKIKLLPSITKPNCSFVFIFLYSNCPSPNRLTLESMAQLSVEFLELTEMQVVAGVGNLSSTQQQRLSEVLGSPWEGLAPPSASARLVRATSAVPSHLFYSGTTLSQYTALFVHSDKLRL